MLYLHILLLLYHLLHHLLLTCGPLASSSSNSRRSTLKQDHTVAIAQAIILKRALYSVFM